MIDDFDSQPVFRTPGILNLLKVVFEIKNDSQLADFLGVTRTAIYTLRMPNRLIGKQIRLVLMEKVAYLGITNWREKLSTQYLEKRMKESGLELQSAENVSPETSFLDLLKVFYKCETDIQLSKRLGLKPNTLSMYRVGRTTLGPLPLLKVLCKVDKLPHQVLSDLLKDNAKLIEMLNDFAEKKKLAP
jgi:hypothetical protein